MSAANADGAGHSSRPSFARRLRSAVVYVAFLACFPTVTAVYLHARYVRARRAAAAAAFPFGPVPGIDARVQKLLGYAVTGRPGSFARHPFEKPAGSVRIGCFGDSFTYGDEVDDGQDFPSLLERQLHDAGWTRVEVLNFGMPWHGFHQSYNVWDQVGRRYALDHVLLGPAGFQADRDDTFNHSGSAYPGYLHARYVLDGEGVRLVEVAGDTLDERLRLYDRLIPLQRYLRYDRQPPAVLRALIPPGSELPNPFYYHRGPHGAEMLEIDRRLIRTMALGDPGRPIVVAHHDAGVVGAGASAGVPNVTAFPVSVPLAFPYLAARGHFTRLGNELVAAHYFQALSGRIRPLTIVRTTDVERPSTVATRGDLAAYTDVSVTVDDVAVGGFTEANRAGFIDPRLLARLGSPFLVGLQPASGSALDACYVPTAMPLEPGLPLTLRQGGRTIALGALRLLTPDATIATVTIPADRVPCSEEAGLEIKIPAGQPVANGNVEVSLGDRTFLKGTSDGSLLTLAPDARLLVAARVSGSLPASPPLPSTGTVWLSARAKNGERFRFALARWTQSDTPSTARAVARPLESSPQP